MDLQQHARGHPLQSCIHAHHRHLDNVRRRALDRCVEGGTLRVLPRHTVVRIKLRQVAAPAKERRGVAILAGLDDDLVEVALHPAEALEVALHDLLGFASRDAQLLRKAVGRQAVDQAVRHRLDAAAQLRGHLIDGDIEDSGADIVVQVLTLPVSLNEARVFREMRHDAHLDLGVVGGNECLEALAHVEGRPDLAAGLGAHRDVLQVRVRRRESTGRGHRLVEGGVDAPVRLDGLDEPLQRGLHLLVFTVCQKMV